MTVTIIAAVARNGVIGVDGGLPWHLPGDLPRLKALTMGHVLVMGRKTFDSIGRPLPGRTTIVVTRRPDWTAAGVEVSSSVESALARAAELGEQVFVMGGGEIYAQALRYADRLELTEVDAAPDGDTYFPSVDWTAWRETAREHHDGFDFVTYVPA
ncbi:MAG: dihydrofolate reductase [Propionibacteriales bacterium]|nr:dihydrofolate reductase [Propionibacteriales bacterium]